jgi:Fic family protein
MRLMKKSPRYVWQKPNWPTFAFDLNQPEAARAIAEARRWQGEIDGKAAAVGLTATADLTRDVFTDEVLATAAIEGERLDPTAVRSSVMHRLGLAKAAHSNRHIDGLVQVVEDAVEACSTPLTHDRLHRWQSAIFPGGTSGTQRIAVGRYRDHVEPMQIVGGSVGHDPVIYFEAPPSSQVPAEMERFLAWFSQTTPVPGARPVIDGLARAAIAHIWFETIHPFEDGNGRIGRAIVDMAIAQDRHTPLRLYSLSRELLESRSAYYDGLTKVQQGDGDVTEWVAWFAERLSAACRRTGDIVDRALGKSRFWATHSHVALNPRQRKVLQRLLDDGDGGFLGGLNADKYVRLTSTSKATATRDLSALVEGGLLWTSGQGKAIRYYVAVPGWTHGVAGAALDLQPNIRTLR